MATTTSQRRPPVSRPLLRRRARLLPVLPAVLLLLVFLAGPVLWAFHASFTNAALTGRNARSPGWVGLENYQRLFTDPVLPLSLALTVIFVAGSAIVGQNLLGLAIAILMKRARRPVAAVVGTAVVAAWVLPEIVAAFAAYAYFSRDGTLNQLLGSAGPRPARLAVFVPDGGHHAGQHLARHGLLHAGVPRRPG